MELVNKLLNNLLDTIQHQVKQNQPTHLHPQQWATALEALDTAFSLIIISSFYVAKSLIQKLEMKNVRYRSGGGVWIKIIPLCIGNNFLNRGIPDRFLSAGFIPKIRQNHACDSQYDR
jgi:hypothetical protein